MKPNPPHLDSSLTGMLLFYHIMLPTCCQLTQLIVSCCTRCFLSAFHKHLNISWNMSLAYHSKWGWNFKTQRNVSVSAFGFYVVLVLFSIKIMSANPHILFTPHLLWKWCCIKWNINLWWKTEIRALILSLPSSPPKPRRGTIMNLWVLVPQLLLRPLADVLKGFLPQEMYNQQID